MPRQSSHQGKAKEAFVPESSANSYIVKRTQDTIMIVKQNNFHAAVGLVVAVQKITVIRPEKARGKIPSPQIKALSNLGWKFS